MEYSYKFRLYPDREQKTQILRTFGCCRFVFNHYLALRKDAYEQTGGTLNYYACAKDLTALKQKEGTLWLKEVDATALQSSLRDLDDAYQHFFRRVKTGGKPGYPRFKSKRFRNPPSLDVGSVKKSNKEEKRGEKMRKNIIVGIAIFATCALFSGCTEKKEGIQTIIIELSDPNDMVETTTEKGEEISAESFQSEYESASNTELVEIDGLSDQIELVYTQIKLDDPIIGMIAADAIPDMQTKDLQAKNMDVYDVQAYIGGEEVIPAGEVTFNLGIDPDAQAILYRLNQDAELTSEEMEIAEGTVSYKTQGCGHWIVINMQLEQETEEVSSEATN